ncbi:MAG TPA: glycosyltransferase family 4 protein [Polyangia bacterium]|nr:glycosyltransferase family 4 protein [Polyangia bacterium]
MRILMYGWEFPPHISGGLGVACFELTRALVNQDHRVTFVLPRLRDELTGQGSHVELLGIAQFAAGISETIDEETRRFLVGVDVAPVDSPLRPYLTDIEYRRVIELIEELGRTRRTVSTGYGMTLTGDYGPNLMSEVVRYAKVAGAVAGRVPHDVIHAHDWLTMLAGLEARRVSGRPLVVHVHATEFDRSGEAVNQAVYDIERAGMHGADRVVAVSHLTAQTIVERYGVDPAKVEVVHNAVTRKTRTQPVTRGERREKVVLFLGRITFQKGPDYFVEAAARVLARRDDVRFVMAGSGDMAPRMIERVGRLRLGRRFHFTGFLTGAAVERMYLESDVYVMPSVSEPFGLSPLEAMCYDVPVIISRQSGVAEVLHHALKVDFWNVEELAGKIIALLDHSPLRDELVSQGAREIESLQWSNAASRLTGIYEQVAAVASAT